MYINRLIICLIICSFVNIRSAFGQIEHGPGILTSTYDAFGILVKITENESLYFYREGNEHVGSNFGRIMGRRYDRNSNQWSESWLVFDDPLFDDRNVAGGLNASGDKIILHFTQYDAEKRLFKNIISLESLDLTGESGTWVLKDPLYENIDERKGFSPFGKSLIENDSTILQGWYMREGKNTENSGPYFCYLMRSTDNGKTWDPFFSTVYTGNQFYFGEANFEDLGDGIYLCIARNNNSHQGFYKIPIMISNDRGLSWGPWKFSNIWGYGSVLPYSYYDERHELLIVSVLDRGKDTYKLYTSSKESVLNDPEHSMQYIGLIDSLDHNGYASTIKFGYNQYFTVYAKANVPNDNSNTKSFNWTNDYLKLNVQHDLLEERIFPNPTTRLLHIPFEGIGVKSLGIFDLGGKEIKDYIYHPDLNVIDVNCLVAGTYILQIKLQKEVRQFLFLKD